jgi:hypothetical protein
MHKFFHFVIALLFIFIATVAVHGEFEEDIITTSKGDLKITFILIIPTFPKQTLFWLPTNTATTSMPRLLTSSAKKKLI